MSGFCQPPVAAVAAFYHAGHNTLTMSGTERKLSNVLQKTLLLPSSNPAQTPAKLGLDSLNLILNTQPIHPLPTRTSSEMESFWL